MCGDWISLFNGKDLQGWKANNSPGSFVVEHGLLRVQSDGGTAAHLFFVGAEAKPQLFKNFELEVISRSEPSSNSGIFFHTDMKVRNKQKHLANGYEVQLNSTAKEKRKTGSLYAITDVPVSPVDETKWFTLRLVVLGNHITVFVDGKQVVDYHEPLNPTRPKNRAGRLLRKSGGAIALQAHDKNSVWYFKDIRIKRLPANGSSAVK